MKYAQKPQNKVTHRFYLRALLALQTFQEPYWLVEFRSEGDAKLLASRSVSLRNCVELWGHDKSLDLLHTSLRAKCQSFAPYFDPLGSFKIEVETFGKHFTQNEKVQKLEVVNNPLESVFGW